MQSQIMQKASILYDLVRYGEVIDLLQQEPTLMENDYRISGRAEMSEISFDEYQGTYPVVSR